MTNIAYEYVEYRTNIFGSRTYMTNIAYINKKDIAHKYVDYRILQ